MVEKRRSNPGRRKRDLELEAMALESLELSRANSKVLNEHLTDCVEARKQNTEMLKTVITRLDAQDVVLSDVKLIRRGIGWMFGAVAFAQGVVELVKAVAGHLH